MQQEPFPLQIDIKKESNGLASPYTWYLAGVALFALVFGYWQFEPVPIETHILGVLVFAVSLFPAVRWWKGGRQEVPMFELVCFSFGLHHGINLYLQPNQIELRRGLLYSLTWDSTSRALLLSALGIASLILGHIWGKRTSALSALPRLDLPFIPQRRGWYLALALCAGLSGRLLFTLGIVQRSDRVAALVTILTDQVPLALFLLTYYVYQRQMGRWWELCLYPFLLITLLIGLSTGMLDETLSPLAVFIIARWQATRQVPWRLILVGVLIFWVLQPIKSEYRNVAWQDGEVSALSLYDRAVIWSEVISRWGDSSGGGSANSDRNRLQEVTSRFNLLPAFSWVQGQSPDPVPYFYGASYSYLGITWVPRFLWPNKPIAQQANIDFSLAYGFQDEEQVKSSMIGIGHIAEAYANFGIPGIIIIMWIEGLIFAILSRVLNSPDSEGGKAIYAVIMVAFLQGILSATAGMFSGIIQTTLMSALIFRMFTFGFRAEASGLKK